MKERILAIMQKQQQENDVNISNAIEKALKDVPEESITNTLNPVFYDIIGAVKYLEEKNEMYNFYIKLLALVLNKDVQNRVHPSFASILKVLTFDEMTIVKNVYLNNYEFVSTYDFEKRKGFFNYKRIRFDYPKDSLQSPSDFNFYIHHLQDALKLIRWPIYNQEAIIEQGIQTGSTEYSRLVTTVLGEKFISCFI